jgi:hypothetical protein
MEGGNLDFQGLRTVMATCLSRRYFYYRILHRYRHFPAKGDAGSLYTHVLGPFLHHINITKSQRNDVASISQPLDAQRW